MRVINFFWFLLFPLQIILSQQTSAQFIIPFTEKDNFQLNTLTFEDITVRDGLPENSANSILQDYLGYLWISTQNGLARYDGYSIKVFNLEKDKDNSLSTSDAIIFEDKRKTLWVGSLAGLNKFDRANETFKLYQSQKNDSTTINSNLVRSFCEDQAGRFWIGTQVGLNLFDRDNEIFTRFYFRNPDAHLNNSLNPDQAYLCVNCVIEDPSSGNLLIGTEKNGLWEFNIKEKFFSKYSENNLDEKIDRIQSFHKSRDGKIWMASTHTLSSLDPKEKIFRFYIDFPTTGDEQNILFTNPIGSVIEDKEGLIWSGFFKGEKGIFCLDPLSGNLMNYSLFPDKPKQARYNKVLSLHEDRTGIIWIGTILSGVVKLDKQKKRFHLLSNDTEFSTGSLGSSIVYSGIYDPKGFIWFCTQKSLDKYDIKDGTYKHYLKDKDCITKYFYKAIQGKDGFIWIGTANCGLISFDPRNESYKYYFNDEKESINLVNKQIRVLLQDSAGNLWIGTDGFGLYRFDVTHNETAVYKNIPGDFLSLSDNQVMSLFEDGLGDIWVGTNLGGLNKFERETEKFSRIGFTCVISIYEDKLKNFWIGDFYSGLNLFDRGKGEVISSYSRNEGLSNTLFQGFVEDNQNNLWIPTQAGLFKFNIISRTFRNYNIEDGLLGSFTLESYVFKGPDGNIYLNTNEGEIFFQPDSIKDDPNPPQVLLTGLSLFNRPDEQLNYEGFISDLKEINLSYDQNDLRFDFVGLHFSSPEKNSYKYILENFDLDWIDAGNERYATFTNLDPGNYVFRVKAANKDGVWNETSASIAVIINPPYWATAWAYLFYILLIGITIYFIWKLQLRRIKIRNEIEMSKFEAQKLHEVDKMKTRFFTNISHEFRTPLTLILGPSKQLTVNSNEEKTKATADLIHRNAKKLNKLVDELLDIAKIESGEMKIRASAYNIVALTKEIALSFYSLAERKKITINLISDLDEIIVYVDKEKVDKILTNILSNAFKFTPENGKISVNIKKHKKECEIAVSDSGTGIPQNELDKIFDRFYQVDDSHTREYEGTGIGLSLTKELIELHKGQIKVESQEGKGSVFHLIFPLGKEHLKPEEIFDWQAAEKETDTLSELVKEYSSSMKHNNIFELSGDLEIPTLLIVEDNSDVRNYILNILSNDYKIYEADDGEEGLDKSFKYIPDLIITDVMMPKLDGFQFCKKLKSDFRTSHIPVIMLTAKATMKDKINGLEIGADDYIMKPFEAGELNARIKNLLEQRNRLHEHFRKFGYIEKAKQNISSADELFIQKAVAAINGNLSDSTFGIDELAEKLAVSRALLFKKINHLTGESPGEIIKRLRLNKAAMLIEKNSGNISEISLEVGFNNPSYFSECFKKQFGVLPSQYHQNKQFS